MSTVTTRTLRRLSLVNSLTAFYVTFQLIYRYVEMDNDNDDDDIATCPPSQRQSNASELVALDAMQVDTAGVV